jgi:hypothetical protein
MSLGQMPVKKRGSGTTFAENPQGLAKDASPYIVR